MIIGIQWLLFMKFRPQYAMQEYMSTLLYSEEIIEETKFKTIKGVG